MNQTFFEKETRKAQRRFNQTFGQLSLCDVRLRQAAMVGVCLLGRSQKRIANASCQSDLQTERAKFMRIQKALEGVFARIEEQFARIEDQNDIL